MDSCRIWELIIAGPSANPFEGLHSFVRDHLGIVNGVVVASTTLVAVLDFMAPRLSVLPRVVYSGTTLLVTAMLVVAIVPQAFGRVKERMGYTAKGSGDQLWRHPAWQFSFSILLIVSIIGFASVARASQGGLIASNIPAVKTLQETLMGMRQDVADIRSGMNTANGKLDMLLDRSREPQKDLVARGYAYDDNGLMKAFKQGDKNATALFVKSNFRVGYEGPLAVLLNGDQPWDAELVAMLPKTMFGSAEACKAGYMMKWELKSPAVDRVAVFKRLCDPARAIEQLNDEIGRDSSFPRNDAHGIRMREVRKSNLAMLTD